MVDHSEKRLRCERFEAKSKRVIFAPNMTDWIGALADPELAARFNQFIDCIKDGHIVPPNFYRRGIERTPDDLLEEEGIKHVHLDEGGGDVILFVVEYDDSVVFLEINTHRHFETEPVGSVLLSLHANCLRQQDAEAGERREERIAERQQIFREGLFGRRRSSDDDLPDEGAPHVRGR